MDEVMESLQPAYVVVLDEGMYIDYSCKECALAFATEHGLTWNDDAHPSFTEGDTNAEAYMVHAGDGECDYVPACSCGVWLDGPSLTDEGVHALLNEDYPEWVVRAYGFSRDGGDN
jgi:hypothetical protein